MKKYLFIINPIAGRNDLKTVKNKINAKMKKEKNQFKIIITKKPENATDVVKNHIDEYDIFVAVGGDGTIKEVASGLAECRKGQLGIIPIGTANDLAKALDMDTDIETNLDRLLFGDMMFIDVGLANGDYFLNIGSVGYDAQVIVNYNKFKKDRGKINYYLSVIYTMIKFRSRRLTIDIDGEMIDGDIFLLAVGNGKYYGGGFKILPDSKFDDGYYHICIIKNISKLSVILLFPTILFGRHVDIDKYVKIYKAKSVNIYSETDIHLNLDGEILGKFKEINFSLPDYKIPIRC